MLPVAAAVPARTLSPWHRLGLQAVEVAWEHPAVVAVAVVVVAAAEVARPAVVADGRAVHRPQH